VSYELSTVDAGSTTLFDPAAFRRGAPALRERILDKHRRGILVSLVWHLRCPKASPSEPDRYAPSSCPADYVLDELSERTKAGARGKHADEWRAMLDEIASLLRSLVDERGERVPVQIRPFHEMTGDWFWWGRTNEPAVYKRVWRETVGYLRDHHGLHDALWVFCPDKPTDAWQTSHGGEPESFYPGDDVVDVIGFDRYDDDSGGFAAGYAADLARIGDLARTHGKIPAVTEIGRDTKRLGRRAGAAWFTRSMLAPLVSGPGKSFAYVALWRNAPWETYVPAPGDADGEADFVAMARDVVLAGGGEDLYASR
jgi:mannan endo-1,4-beta-mannosidase